MTQWNVDARAVQPARAVFFYGTRLREHGERDRDFGYEICKRASQVMLERLPSARRQWMGQRAGRPAGWSQNPEWLV